MLTFLLLFVPLYTHSSVYAKRQVPLLPSPLYNNVTLSNPKWWTGTNGANCDGTNYYNKSIPHTNSVQLGTTTFRGEKACGPMPFLKAPNVTVYFYKGAPPEGEWQCTELVKRYLYQAFGAPDLGSTNGNQVVTNYANSDNLFTSYTNDGTPYQVPVVGDVLSFNEFTKGDGGHTAIVIGSTYNGTPNYQLTILDQNNGNDSSGTGTLSVSNWKIGTQPYIGTVSGWLDTNTLVQSANASSYENILSGIDTVAANNVWAVGHSQASNGVRSSLIEHWEGSSWSIVSSPNPGSGDNYLQGVTALSATNIWAVGYYPDGLGDYRTILEHYDGSSWTADTTDSTVGQLFAITKVSSTEAWAVGTSDGKQLTAHLINGSWTNAVDTSRSVQLEGVSAVSASNVIAVGISGSQTAAIKWNGSIWSSTSSAPPNPGSNSRLWAVSALNASHIYAVGDSNSTPNGAGFITIWNGSTWSTPQILSGTSGSIFYGVKAVSSTDIWIVGQIAGTGLVEQYNGSSLRQVNANYGNYLYGVTVNLQTGNTWAVGYQVQSSYAQTLTEFYN